MFNNLSLRNPSSWTMFIFGVLAFFLGLVGIIQPEITLQLTGIDPIEQAQRATGDATTAFVIASSMASFNMGVYYMLAALSNWQAFYRWTVPFRMVTFCVFMLAVAREIAPSGFVGVALWELIGALLTGAALWYESRRNIE
ncbi:MAG: hypothetical protein RLP44_15035 [Aggregatilineales bacterium]